MARDQNKEEMPRQKEGQSKHASITIPMDVFAGEDFEKPVMNQVIEMTISGMVTGKDESGLTVDVQSVSDIRMREQERVPEQEGGRMVPQRVVIAALGRRGEPAPTPSA